MNSAKSDSGEQSLSSGHSSPDQARVSSTSTGRMIGCLATAPIHDGMLNEIGELIRRIFENVPGLSPSVPLILAFIESNINFYRNYMDYSSNMAEEPLDLSGQPVPIDRSSYGPLRERSFELIDSGLEHAICLSRLTSRFLDSVLISISLNTEVYDLALARVEATLPNVQRVPVTLGDKLNLLLRNLREINIKMLTLNAADRRGFGRNPRSTGETMVNLATEVGLFRPPPLSTAPPLAPIISAPTTSTVHPPALSPALSVSTWTTLAPTPSVPPSVNTYTDPEICSISLLSNTLERIGAFDNLPPLSSSSSGMIPLSVDIVSSHTEATDSRSLSDVGPRIWTQPQLPPPPPVLGEPRTSASPNITARNRSQSLSKSLRPPLVCHRVPNSPMDSANLWPAKRLRPGAPPTSLCTSESATSFATISGLPSRPDSPNRYHEQPIIQVGVAPHSVRVEASANEGGEHDDEKLRQLRRGSVSSTSKTTGSQSPSTSSMATVDTARTSPCQRPDRDKKSRPSRRTQQQPKSQMHQEENSETTKTLASRAERSMSPPETGTAETAAKLDRTVMTLESQDMISGSSTSTLPQGKFLMLNDLSDKLRILVVEDNYLRRATVFTKAPQIDEPSTSTSDENPYNRTWRICLDPLDNSPDSCKGSKPTSINSTGSEASRRRRYTEEHFQAWALLQKAVLYVAPESPDQLVPGTRVCAVWSASLGKAYFPGRITDCATVESDNVAEVAFPVQFDDGDSTCVSFESILLLPNEYKSPKGPGPMPSGRRRLRSPLRSSELPSIPAKTSSRSSSGAGSGEGKTEIPNGLVNGGGNKVDETTSDVADSAVTWTPIGDPLKSRYKGMICYEALQRNVDGLVVRLNDMVTFMTTEHSESYLGRIERIFSTRRNTLKVTANWLYTPREMGHAGDLVARCEGAVFKSSHFDNNDAFCISGPVRVASCYSEFLMALREHKKNPPSSTTATSSTAASTRRRWRRLTVLESDEEEDERTTSDEESVVDTPQYFIAGVFDFVKGCVVAWDSDLAAELHLPTLTSPHN